MLDAPHPAGSWSDYDRFLQQCRHSRGDADRAGYARCHGHHRAGAARPAYRAQPGAGAWNRGAIALDRRQLPGGIQTLFGGNITIYTELCEQARDETYRDMLAHARRLGANAIVAVRYDATELMTGLTEVLCYGTAVVVEPRSPSNEAIRVCVARTCRLRAYRRRPCRSIQSCQKIRMHAYDGATAFPLPTCKA